MTTEPVKIPNNRKWMMIAGAIVAAVLIVLIAISASKGDDKGGNGGQLVGVDEVTAELSGVPQNGLVLGKADAPVTITEYLDMQCPHCASAAVGTVPKIITQYVKTGQAKLQLQPIAFLGDDSVKGAKTIIAAAEQNKAGEFTEILFRNQGVENSGWLTDAIIDQVVTAVKADGGKLNDARDSSATKATFDKIAAAAKADNVQSTPTFIVRGPKGQYSIQNRENMAEFAQAIAAVK